MLKQGGPLPEIMYKGVGDESATICPQCGLPEVIVMVPCPDGRPGCLVAHFGTQCPRCPSDVLLMSRTGASQGEGDD